jgi:hypothetical protein
MDIPGLIEDMIRRRAFNRVANNPLTQFGSNRRRYLGATIMPERNVDQNEFTEDAIRYRTVVANDATRYSPVQLKAGMLYGSVSVRLGEVDTGSEITARLYDTLLKVLSQNGSRPTMEGVKAVLNWAENTLNLPIREKMEVQRWQCLVDALVPQRGDDGFSRNFAYSNPTGHRVGAAAAWSNDANDPYDDIMAMFEFLVGKGQTVIRIIASTPVVSKLTNNAKIQQRVGRFKITDGTVTGIPGRASLQRINDMFSEDDLPPIEKYDLQYRTQTGSGYFLKRDVMVFICASGVDAELDKGDANPVVVPNVLGYQAIGVAAGQSTSGIPTFVEFKDGKPPSVRGQIWATTLPVLQDVEAVGVITGIT